MRVLVTGGSGFIGKAVMKHLQEKGHEGVSYDLPDDVRSPLNLDIWATGCEAVIHLAGVLGTAELFDAPHGAVAVNVGGSLNVLQTCARLGMRYVGITMPDVFPSVYTATKICAARLATAWHLAHGVPVSHVRAFNAFGEGQKVKGVQKIVPTFATRAWRNEPIPIWGDGSQTVDLVYADDIGRMLVDALNYGDDQIFDAGTGQAVTVLDIANEIKTVTKSRSEIQFLPMRKGEQATKIVAQGEGWDLLGWKPECLASDLWRTIEWYQQDRP